jgi:hypothetical protein
VFENKLLSGIFGLKREKVTGGWINLCSEESRYCLDYKSKLRLAVHVSYMEEKCVHSYGQKI